jgi:hypothetical protein
MLIEFLTDNWSFSQADGMQNEDVLHSGEASNNLRTITRKGRGLVTYCIGTARGKGRSDWKMRKKK